MIVFGWGRQTRRTLGIVGTSKCSHCGTTADFHLVQRRTWFTLFVIPVIPYGSEHVVLCNSCEWGWKPTEDEVLQLKSAINVAVTSPPPATAIADTATSRWRVGDMVTPKVGASLRVDPGGSAVATGSADRTSPAVVLATRGTFIQVRDAGGRIGWLQPGEVD